MTREQLLELWDICRWVATTARTELMFNAAKRGAINIERSIGQVGKVPATEWKHGGKF